MLKPSSRLFFFGVIRLPTLAKRRRAGSARFGIFVLNASVTPQIGSNRRTGKNAHRTAKLILHTQKVQKTCVFPASDSRRASRHPQRFRSTPISRELRWAAAAASHFSRARPRTPGYLSRCATLAHRHRSLGPLGRCPPREAPADGPRGTLPRLFVRRTRKRARVSPGKGISPRFLVRATSAPRHGRRRRRERSDTGGVREDAR